MRSPQPPAKAAIPQFVTPSHTCPYRLWGIISVNDPFPGRLHQIRPLQNATAVTIGASSVFSAALRVGGGIGGTITIL